MKTFPPMEQNRASRLLLAALRSCLSDEAAVAMGIEKVAKECDRNVTEIRPIAETVLKDLRAQAAGTLKDKVHETPQTALPTQDPTQEQEQEQEQEESPLDQKVREIVETNSSMTNIDLALRALQAELKKAGEKISLGTLRAQAKVVMREKKDKARRKEAPPALKTLKQARANTEGTGHRLGARYSMQFAVAGQQPQSKAAAILAEHNSGLAYDHVAQKWLQYIGTQWVEITNTAAFRLVQRWIDAGLTKNDGYTASFLTGVITFLKGILATDGFDDNPMFVPFKNGVLDLSTMKLMEHSPKLKISWCLPFDYNPHATCEPVKAWLKESVGGDDLQVELLRAYIKAILTGRSDLQRYLELIGPGGTGKGEYIRLCSNLVGKCNVLVTTLKQLEENRFETARLHRKRLCVITDAEKYSGDVSTLKAMTGQDDLRFEEKHKQGGENFKFKGMVLIAANQEITSSDYTSGMQRRRITERFDNQVAPDKRRDLEHEFEPYLPGVIAWALSMDDARMKQLLVETDRHVPTVGNFNTQTLKKVNPLAAWADERLVVDPEAETPVGKKIKVTISEDAEGHRESRTEIENADKWLFANYCEWCMGTGIKEMASRNFTGLLKDLLCNQLKLERIEKLDRAGSSLSRFKGIRLRTDTDSETPSPLSPRYSKNQQKYSKSTANKENGTAKLAKSEFPNSENISASPLQGGKEEREREIFSIQENSDFAGFAVLAVPNEQNQQPRKDFAVPVLGFCCTDPEKSTANSLESPPSPGDGYVESLLADSYQPVTIDENEAPRPAAPLSPNARRLYQWLLESKFAGWKPSSELAMSIGMGTGQVRSAAMELKAHRLARFENDSIKVNLLGVN